MQGQERGMVLDGARFGGVQHRLRHKQRHVGHDAQVGVGRLHQLQRLGHPPALGLVHGKALLAREHLERVLGPARLVGRAEDGDHVLLALQQLLEHGLAEGLLPMHDDTHWFSAPYSILSPLPACGERVRPAPAKAGGEGQQQTPTSECAAAPHLDPLPMPEEAWGEGEVTPRRPSSPVPLRRRP